MKEITIPGAFALPRNTTIVFPKFLPGDRVYYMGAKHGEIIADIIDRTIIHLTASGQTEFLYMTNDYPDHLHRDTDLYSSPESIRKLYDGMK